MTNGRHVFVITMAGLGSRFLDVGYTVPKYQILAGERTLLEWSLLGICQFRDSSGFRFVVSSEDSLARAAIASAAARLDLDYTVSTVPGRTAGQAETALLGSTDLHGTSISIWNIDTFIHPEALADSFEPGRAAIYCWQCRDDGPFSWAKVDRFARVVAVAEKRKISDLASVGLYSFASAEQYRHAYEETYPTGRNVHAEQYVAPVYAAILESDHVVAPVLDAAAVAPIGTPAELDKFIADLPSLP